MKEWIFGRNPVYECLRAGRRIFYRLWLEESSRRREEPAARKSGSRDEAGTNNFQPRPITEVVRIARKLNIAIEYVPRGKMDPIHSGHQGVALEVGEYPYVDLIDILDKGSELHERPFILILDALQDPQNLGTLIRTAEITGVHGVLLPFRHTASITPAVVNASSGASEHLLIARLNLTQAITSLKQEGLWVVGLDEDKESQPLNQVNMDGPIALVVGNEGYGMHSLVKKTCDLLLRLPMVGKVGSLNAATAGSIALYFAWQARGFKHTIDDQLEF